MLDLPLRHRGHAAARRISPTCSTTTSTDDPIRVAGHCFGCTAGQGSSCGGALPRSDAAASRGSLSIIIPVLDEEAEIADALDALAPLRARGVEIIVVDGGSRDATVALAAPLADRVIAAPRGRAAQMNAGAAAATRRRSPVPARRHAAAGRGRSAGAGRARAQRPPMGPLRRAHRRPASAASGRRRADEPALARDRHRHRRSGDVRHGATLFERGRRLSRHPADGGHRAVAARSSGPAGRSALRARAITSGRRWEQRGVLRTILLMWRLRLAYSLGARSGPACPPLRLCAPPS